MSTSKHTTGEEPQYGVTFIDPSKEMTPQALELLQAKSTLAQGLRNLQNMSTPGFISKYQDKVEIAKYLNTAIETVTSASKVTAVLMVCAWNMASCKDPKQRLFSQLSPLEGKSTSLDDLLVNESDEQPRITIDAEDALGKGSFIPLWVTSSDGG